MLKSNRCDYSDAYILVTGDITIIGKKCNLAVVKNCGPFIKSISKIDEPAIDDVEDLDMVMSMYRKQLKLFWNNRQLMPLFWKWSN